MSCSARTRNWVTSRSRRSIAGKITKRLRVSEAHCFFDSAPEQKSLAKRIARGIVRETMSHPALRLPSVSIRLGAIGVLVPTLLFAFYLSVAPQVHQRLHPRANDAEHECAVTMFVSGNCEHAAGDQLLVEAQRLPSAGGLPLCRLSIFTAPARMSILEHAPPSHS